MTSSTISLVIITCERHSLIRELLSIVEKQIKYLSQVIIVDNGDARGRLIHEYRDVLAT